MAGASDLREGLVEELVRDSPYPPHRAVSAREAIDADRRARDGFGIPSIVLMEHAARGLAALVASIRRRRALAGPVAVVCGPGNNGGDGYGCARFLASWGVPVRVLCASPAPPPSPDARLEHDLAARDLGVVALGSGDAGDVRAFARALDGATVLVDALFGVGLSRPLVAPYPAFIEAVNSMNAVRVAADVPSGLDADTGVAMPVAVRAHVTAAMGMPKAGCGRSDGAAFSGEVVEVDIGLPAAVHRAFLR